MAIYEFEAEDGTKLDLDFPLGECPVRIGETIKRNGKTLRRLPPWGTRPNVLPDCSFVSTSLPKNYTLHKERGGRFVNAPGTPEHGACIIENRAQLDSLVRAANARGENMAYAGPGRQHYAD